MNRLELMYIIMDYYVFLSIYIHINVHQGKFRVDALPSTDNMFKPLPQLEPNDLEPNFFSEIWFSLTD